MVQVYLTLTAAAISSISSPIYSLPVPLNGILVLTILTKTPILSIFCLILYKLQLIIKLNKSILSLKLSKELI